MSQPQESTGLSPESYATTQLVSAETLQAFAKTGDTEADIQRLDDFIGVQENLRQRLDKARQLIDQAATSITLEQLQSICEEMHEDLGDSYQYVAATAIKPTHAHIESAHAALPDGVLARQKDGEPTEGHRIVLDKVRIDARNALLLSYEELTPLDIPLGKDILVVGSFRHHFDHILAYAGEDTPLIISTLPYAESVKKLRMMQDNVQHNMAQAQKMSKALKKDSKVNLILGTAIVYAIIYGVGIHWLEAYTVSGILFAFFAMVLIYDLVKK